jgi:hypothetical protein
LICIEKNIFLPIKCKWIPFTAGSVFHKVFGNSRYAGIQEYGYKEMTVFCTESTDKADVFETINTV